MAQGPSQVTTALPPTLVLAANDWPRLEPERHAGDEGKSRPSRMELGLGSFAKVFLHHNRSTGELASGKVFYTTPAAQAHAQRELQAYTISAKKQVLHPGVLRLLGVRFENRLVACMVLEYCAFSLDELWERRGGVFNLDDCRVCCTNLLRAVAWLHSNGIWHRDLSPANVMLTSADIGEPMTLKLIDLGSSLCKAAGGPRERAKQSITTWPYQAPEITLGGLYDASIDEWGVGVITVELLTGSRQWYQFANTDMLVEGAMRHLVTLLGHVSVDAWAEGLTCPGWQRLNELQDAARPQGGAATFELRHRFGGKVDPGATEVVNLLMAVPPRRHRASKVLQHTFLVQPYFWSTSKLPRMQWRPWRYRLRCKGPTARPMSTPKTHAAAAAGRRQAVGKSRGVGASGNTASEPASGNAALGTPDNLGVEAGASGNAAPGGASATGERCKCS